MIEKNKIKTLDEDGFLNLIASRSTKDIDPKYLEKQKQEMKKVKEAAKEMINDPKWVHSGCYKSDSGLTSLSSR